MQLLNLSAEWWDRVNKVFLTRQCTENFMHSALFSQYILTGTMSFYKHSMLLKHQVFRQCRLWGYSIASEPLALTRCFLLLEYVANTNSILIAPLQRILRKLFFPWYRRGSEERDQREFKCLIWDLKFSEVPVSGSILWHTEMLPLPFNGICTHTDTGAAEEYKADVQFLVLPSSSVWSYPAAARGTFFIALLNHQQT